MSYRTGLRSLPYRITSQSQTTPTNPIQSNPKQDSFTTASGLKIKKLVKGSGPGVEVGDLVGVRFKGNYGTYEFDNIFTTAEPYYMRAGVGTLVKVRQTARASVSAVACLVLAFLVLYSIDLYCIVLSVYRRYIRLI